MSPPKDDIELAYADMGLLYLVANIRPALRPGQRLPWSHCNSTVGHWANLPIAQWMLDAKLNRRLPVGDGEDNFKAACRRAMEAQSRVLAAFNDAGVQQRDIVLV